jgi:hypothetical protein
VLRVGDKVKSRLLDVLNRIVQDAAKEP